MHEIISVTFEINAQHHRDGQFSVPKKVCDILGLGNGDDIKLIVATAAGRVEANAKLKSGMEIYDPVFKQYVKSGDLITVTAGRPERF